MAPALYAFNVPRYFTLLLRARQWAQANDVTLSWCYARDIPLHREDRDLPSAQLDDKRLKWLEQHDQDTAHLASQTALAFNLPVRLTDTVDRDYKLWRGRRGKIVGWLPHPDEDRQEVDGEILLSKLPVAIYVYFPGAKWKIADDLPEGVYPLKPASRTWLVNKSTKVKVRRTGFFIVPDFSSTAHMIQGQNLDALFANIMEDNFIEASSDELQVISYVMLSRAKFVENVWVLSAFPRQIFTRGPPAGPHILMKKLRGDITAEEVAAQFSEIPPKKSKKKQQPDPLMILHTCSHCFLSGRPDYKKPARAFGVTAPQEVLSKILVDGAWTRCLQCREHAEDARRRAKLPEMYSSKTLEAERESKEGSGIRCTKCMKWRPYEFFRATAVQHRNRNKTVICNVCQDLRKCDKCQAWCQPTAFRTARGVQLDTCKACMGIDCSACGKNLSTDSFTLHDIRNYLTLCLNVVCSTCAADGKKAKKGQARRNSKVLKACSVCQISKPAFLAYRLVKGTYSEVCKECETVRCSACSADVKATLFKQVQLNNYFSLGQGILCGRCSAKGCTLRDTQSYRCTDCTKTFGRTKFNETSLKNFKKDSRSVLACKDCYDRAQRIESVLRKAGNYKCNCHQPIHAERCNLFKHTVEQNWPGKMKGLSRTDWLFWSSRQRY